MIRNLTSGKIVSERARKAVSLIDKTLGMILEKNSGGLIFDTRFGIHTFFMKNSIDIIVCDYNNNVVKLREKLCPSNIFMWNPKFNILIEVPENSIRDSKTKVGDRLKIS